MACLACTSEKTGNLARLAALQLSVSFSHLRVLNLDHRPKPFCEFTTFMQIVRPFLPSEAHGLVVRRHGLGLKWVLL